MTRKNSHLLICIPDHAHSKKVLKSRIIPEVTRYIIYYLIRKPSQAFTVVEQKALIVLLNIIIIIIYFYAFLFYLYIVFKYKKRLNFTEESINSLKKIQLNFHHLLHYKTDANSAYQAYSHHSLEQK